MEKGIPIENPPFLGANLLLALGSRVISYKDLRGAAFVKNYCLLRHLMVLSDGSPGYRWVFPKIGVPQNGWFIMENPIKIHDLGPPLIFGNAQIFQLNS